MNKLIVGTNFNYDDSEKKFNVDPVSLTWPNGFQEELYVFGITNIQDNFKPAISKISGDFDSEFRTAGIRNPTITRITRSFTEIDSILDNIKDKDDALRTKLTGIIDDIEQLNNIYGKLMTLANNHNKYVRFRHTYKVLKKYFMHQVDPDDDTSKVPIYLDPNKNNTVYQQNPSVEINHNLGGTIGGYGTRAFTPLDCEDETGWADEFGTRYMTGLDENGYPLEIAEEGGTWYVLTDRWYREIAENSWQMTKIKNKYGAQSGIVKHIEEVKAHGIRTVDPNFGNDNAYIDLLEMAVFIYNELDALRDDLRDGRYHPFSKTTTDYIIRAEGGLNVDANKPTHVRDPLKKAMEIKFDTAHDKSQETLGYVKAEPSNFEDASSKEEKKVTRGYDMRWFEGGTESLKEGKRKPTTFNPAFDRRALDSEQPLIHWGRLLYYENSTGINRVSVNPYPVMSTRGIAKYIVYWLAVKTKTLEEASTIAKSDIGYDIGIRRPLLKGPFNKDPFKTFVTHGATSNPNTP